MIAKNGKGVFGGVAVGTIKIFSDTLKTEKRFVNDTEGEIEGSARSGRMCGTG